MTSIALVLENPFTKNYKDFIEKVISKLPLSVSEIDIIPNEKIKSVKCLQEILVTLYTQAREIATIHGFSHRLSINVLINMDRNRFSGRWGHIYHPKQESPDISGHTTAVPCQIDEIQNSKSFLEQETNNINVSALGGTFDHLHDAHKILLTLAAFVAVKKVIVGVTGDKLLVNKKYSEFMESLDERINSVVRFFQRNCPNVTFSIYEINDIYGPTGFVLDIQALVLSEETAKGGDAVNTYRENHGLSHLHVISANVIGGGSADNNWAGKLSSTTIREAEAKMSIS